MCEMYIPIEYLMYHWKWNIWKKNNFNTPFFIYGMHVTNKFIIWILATSNNFIKAQSYFQQRAPRPPLSKVIPATRDHY